MASTTVLDAAFAHHTWANDRLLRACVGLDQTQLATDVPGTFGSIIDTLRHLIGADVGYLLVLGEIDQRDESVMDVAELSETNGRCGLAWVQVLANNSDPDELLTRHHQDGSSGTAPVGIRIAQALHHGTDHRSQVCTALTALGIEPPAIDVWDYAAEQGLYTETDPPA